MKKTVTIVEPEKPLPSQKSSSRKVAKKKDS